MPINPNDMFFDKEGNQLKMIEWANLFESWDYRNLHQTVHTWDNKIMSVSTVWLGLSHGEDERGRPLIFESAVEKNGEFQVAARYATAEEAVDGHRAICMEYRIPFDPIPPVKQFHQLRFDSHNRWKDLG